MLDATLVTGIAENEDDNDDNGTITIDPGITTLTGENLLIQGVMLDVSGADGARYRDS